jgi:hypothetical protein
MMTIRRAAVYVSGAPRRLAVLAMALVLVQFALPALAEDGKKLIVPVYPGAVPGMMGKSVAGKPKAMDEVNNVVYLSKDPIAKVKGFYDKAPGGLRPQVARNGQQSFGAYLEMAFVGESVVLAGTSMHSLGESSKVPVKGDQQPLLFQQLSGKNIAYYPFTVMAELVDWNGKGDPRRPYKPQDLDAAYAKYHAVLSSFYAVNGATGKSRRAELVSTLQTNLQQRETKIWSGDEASQKRNAKDTQRQQDKLTAESAQDDPEFQRIMDRKPKLAQDFYNISMKMQKQLEQGQTEQAMQTNAEADKLLRSDPEMAALMRKWDEREAKHDANIAKRDSKGRDTRSQTTARVAKMRWDTSLETLNALAAEGYATYIVIDERLVGRGEVIRDRKRIAERSGGQSHGTPPDFEAQDDGVTIAAMIRGEQPPAAPAAAAPNSKANSSATASAPAEQTPAQKKSTSSDSKSSLKKLKKLF